MGFFQRMHINVRSYRNMLLHPTFVVTPYDTSSADFFFLFFKNERDTVKEGHAYVLPHTCIHTERETHTHTHTHSPLWIYALSVFCSSKPIEARACLHPMEALFRRISIMWQHCGNIKSCFSSSFLHLHLKILSLTHSAQ